MRHNRRKLFEPYPCDNADGVPGYKLPVSDDPSEDEWRQFKVEIMALADCLVRRKGYQTLRERMNAL